MLNSRSLHHWMKLLSLASVAVWDEIFAGTSAWDSSARFCGAAILQIQLNKGSNARWLCTGEITLGLKIEGRF